MIQKDRHKYSVNVTVCKCGRIKHAQNLNNLPEGNQAIAHV